jgi:ADP-heptose:LPS heptosyltransferase
LALNPVYNREFYLSDSLIKVAKSFKKVGFICSEADKRHRKIADKWYTDLIPKEEGLQHNILLGYTFLDYMKINYLHKNSASKKLSELLENSKDVNEKDKYYVIVPGSGWKGRSWPIEKWAQLCQLISKESKLKGIVLGSKAESPLGLKIASVNEMILNLVGKTSINEMAEIISRAKFIISNETSATHLAMQLNIPSICILGGGHYGQFLPIPVEVKINTPPIVVNRLMSCYGCNWQCPYQQSKSESVKCISDINVDEVFNVLKHNFSLN